MALAQVSEVERKHLVDMNMEYVGMSFREATIHVEGFIRDYNRRRFTCPACLLDLDRYREWKRPRE